VPFKSKKRYAATDLKRETSCRLKRADENFGVNRSTVVRRYRYCRSQTDRAIRARDFRQDHGSRIGFPKHEKVSSYWKHDTDSYDSVPRTAEPELRLSWRNRNDKDIELAKKAFARLTKSICCRIILNLPAADMSFSLQHRKAAKNDFVSLIFDGSRTP